MSASPEVDHLAEIPEVGRRRAEYSRSRRATSTRISLVPASLRAAREVRCFVVYPPAIAFLGHWTWLHLPDFVGIFGDSAVSGELPRTGHIQDGLPRPIVLVVI